MIFIVFISILSTVAFATSTLENFFYQLEYKDYILNGNKNKKPFNAEIECAKYLSEAKVFWAKEKKFIIDGYLTEGEMQEAFSHDEILNMKNVNFHGVLGKVRGQDKILLGGYAYGGSPSFPHTRPGCEKYFKEEVRIFKDGETYCREVKFTEPKTNETYRQKFCEKNTKIYISLDPLSDAGENCFAGKDLIKCH